MKAKFCIPLLVLISFTLMGCPAGKFYTYTFVEDIEKSVDFEGTPITYDDNTELFVSCGNYVEFVREKDRGLLVILKVVSKKKDVKESLIQHVVSSNFGTLTKSHPISPRSYILRDTIDKLYFDLSLNDVSHRKIRKRIKNDTISIELQNGRKLLFIKKEP